MADEHTGADVWSDKPNIYSVKGCSDGSKHQNLWPRPLARRWILMLFLGTCLLYCARMAVPICAVSMAAAFQWNKIDSGLVLGGFFWGYCFTQILGGHASDKVGGERVLLVSVATWALITALTPLVAQLGSHTLALMTTARFLMGLLQGEVSPRQLESLSGDSNFSQWNLSHWIRLLQKPPVWAMVFAHMCTASTSNTLLSWLPTYFKESFPDATGSVYNVIPWLVAIPSALGGGYMSDYLKKHGGYELSTVRKIMQLLAMGGSSLFIMLLSGGAFTSFTSAVTFVSVAVGLSTFTSCGVSVNVHDLAPSCAGALYGFMNMLGAFMGLLLVSLSGYLIEVTLSWTSMFSLVSLVNTSGLVIFVLFGDARRVDLDASSSITVV
ncbi:hypothetical protein F2P81_010959 [Scophthalmus maximus]|uniref:Solute carrier family 17 member 9-like n=1 Tax=Scophthalmus maximus TaxID=52904 RepID=A0A6A4SQK7_SCOMX|nr:hypothetical protein F2P81_010959 [Scophthalmus maximus]